jgi:hypothetical protein
MTRHGSGVAFGHAGFFSSLGGVRLVLPVVVAVVPQAVSLRAVTPLRWPR